MSKQLKLRRGTTAQHSTFTGAEGEVTVDTTKDTLVVHDGVTAGGKPLATEAGLAGKQPLSNNLTTYASTGIGFRNRIINGDMRIDQRNNGASVTANDNVFPVDRFRVVATQTSKGTAQRNAGSVAPPTGFVNYLGFTSSSAYSVTAGDQFAFTQPIEGLNVADLAWGTSGAQAVTLSFWVRSSLTGTFGGALRNTSATRSYAFSYTISAANTWEQKTVTIAGDVTGTWATDNSIGIWVMWGLGVGSTTSGAAGSWASANYVSTTGATSVVGTSGAAFYITGVQLEAGTVATPFERRDYGRELMMCQRYYESVYLSVNTYAAQWTGVEFFGVGVPFKTTKRVAPTIPNPTASGYWVTAAQNAYSAAGVHTFQAAYSSEFGFSLKSNRPAGNTTPTVANMYLWEGALTISASSEL